MRTKGSEVIDPMVHPGINDLQRYIIRGDVRSVTNEEGKGT